MIQNLFNSINNNIQEKTPAIGSNFAENDTKVDFQKLFEKQNNIQSDKNNTEAEIETDVENASANSDIKPLDKENKADDKNNKLLFRNKEEGSEEAIEPDETFAGGILYDIKELIAYINAQNGEQTVEADDEIINDLDLVSLQETETTEETDETLDADAITKKLIYLEDEDGEEDKKDTENKQTDGEVETDAEVKEVPADIETLQKVLNTENIDNLLKTAEVTTDEVQETVELQASVETQTKETETVSESDSILEDIIDEEQIKELNIESIETETDSGAQSDLMHQETAEEHGVKVMLQTDGDFADAQLNVKQTVNTQGVKPNTQVLEANPNKIIEQITKQMESMQSGSRVNIVLNPESLGKVSVQLINTPEGLSAQFTVATQEARNLIMKGLDGLKESLISHGVSVDNVSVKLNDTQESEYNADWTEQEGSRGGNKEQGSQRGQKNKQEFEQMMAFAQNDEI